MTLELNDNKYNIITNKWRQYWTCLGLIIPFYWITGISGAQSLPCYSNYWRLHCLRKMRTLYNSPSSLSIVVHPKPWSLDTGLLTWFGPSSHSKVVPDRWVQALYPVIRVLQGCSPDLGRGHRGRRWRGSWSRSRRHQRRTRTGFWPQAQRCRRYSWG